VGSVAYTGRKREGVDEGQVVDRLEIVNKTLESTRFQVSRNECTSRKEAFYEGGLITKSSAHRTLHDFSDLLTGLCWGRCDSKSAAVFRQEMGCLVLQFGQTEFLK
jgi:hypothetical protein